MRVWVISVKQNKLSTTKNSTRRPGVNDQGLRQFTGYHLKRAYNVVRSDLTKKLEPLGLRITTYSSLLLIVENPGVRQSQLAASLDIERPNMVMIIDDLEQKGWISRKRLENDRRAYALFSTPLGDQVCKEAVKLDFEHEAKILGALSKEEVNTLIAALNKIEQVEE